MPPKSDAATGVVKLPTHCVTTVVADLHARLLTGAPTLDASEVESIGQAMLQLLVAARAEAGGDFAIVNPSPAFVDRVIACCLAEAVGLTIEEESVQ